MFAGTISSLQDLALLGTSSRSTPCWYRGQADADWLLIPSIYRPFGPLKTKAEKTRAARLERDVYRHFCKHAVAFQTAGVSGIPDWNALLTAQHHGCPTRLLDWSSNIHVAAFFAVGEQINRDGAIWCLDTTLAAEPTLGCRQSPTGGYSLDALSQELGTPAFMHRRTGDKSKKFRSFIALLDPPSSNPRITAQQGRFTIHVSSVDSDTEQDHGTCLHAVRPSGALVRYKIPAAAKPGLLSDLNRFGVNHRVLFPDLEGLGRYMRHCLGEWASSSKSPV